MIELRVQQLANKGYSLEAVKKMPFASSESEPHAFLAKDKVSSFARKILTLVGCDEEWLEKEAERLFAAAAAAGNQDDLDVSAHKLRSTLATFWGNGGVDADTLDGLLGHVNCRNKGNDFASWSAAEQIVRKMERAIYLGNLCVGRNPAFVPVDVFEDTNFLLQGNSGYYFRCNEDMYLEFDLVTLEGDDPMFLIVPKEIAPKYIIRREILDTKGSKKTRPILGKLPSEKDIDGWIKEACAIDLSEIVYKYGGKE